MQTEYHITKFLGLVLQLLYYLPPNSAKLFVSTTFEEHMRKMAPHSTVDQRIMSLVQSQGFTVCYPPEIGINVQPPDNESLRQEFTNLMNMIGSESMVNKMHEAIIKHLLQDIVPTILGTRGDLFLKCFNSVFEGFHTVDIMMTFAALVHRHGESLQLPEEHRTDMLKFMLDRIK